MGLCHSQSGNSTTSNSRSKSGRLVGRELSAFERLSWKATPYVTIAHWFQVAGPTTPEDLAEALTDVHWHFAALQAIIEQKRLFLRPDLKPDIEIDLDADISPHSLALLGAESASAGIGPTWRACEGKLLWRARILREGWLLLIFHHAIIDEKSISMLMKELLSILSGRERTSPKPSLDPKLTQLLDQPDVGGPGTSGKFTRLMEQRKGGRWPGKAVGRLADIVPSSKRSNVVAREGKEWPKPDGLAPWQDRKTRSLVTSIPVAEKLRAVCRERGLTVNTALLASLALALRGQMSRAGTVGMRPILATDARSHIPDGQDLFGSYSLGARYRAGWGTLDVAEDTDFWNLATCAKKAVEDAGKKLEIHNIAWYMRFLTAAMGKKDVAWLQGAMDLDGPDQGRTNAILVSNAGVVSGMESGHFKVTQSYFASHQAAWGPFVWLNVMTIGARMCLTLCYVDPLLADEKAKLLLNDVESRLTRACDSLERALPHSEMNKEDSKTSLSTDRRQVASV
ncbi:unnamed protein product [Durusdinium trenchii]|uniref:Condensation domain-containing protein n=1 Tax=Durusdinium trenchii TaxID=1381693 RepID=A0ABP0JN00_9DINO